MFLRAVAGGDQGDIELIARRIGAEKLKPRQNQHGSAENSAGF
jgi:hypothetical protein